MRNPKVGKGKSEVGEKTPGTYSYFLISRYICISIYVCANVCVWVAICIYVHLTSIENEDCLN